MRTIALNSRIDATARVDLNHETDPPEGSSKSDLTYTPPFPESPDGPFLYVTANSGNCVGRQLLLMFEVPGGETTEPTPFQLSINCSSSNTLTAAMAVNGGVLTDITNGVVDFGQFGIVGSESPIVTGEIPTLSEWAMIVFAVILLGAGVFLILGRLS